MKSLLFDTDIISTFCKIRRLDLLKKLFPNQKFLITPAVESDLIKAQEAGYDFVNYLWREKLFEVVAYSEPDYVLIKKFSAKRKALGEGQVTTLSVAKNRNLIVVTNDYLCKKECIKENIKYINLTAILSSLWKEGILTKKEVERLIEEIEEKDRIKFKNKDEILK